jgi:hypothetical protein
MKSGEALNELEPIIQAVELAQAKLAHIRTSLSATDRKGDLIDDAAMSIMWALTKLKALKIVCQGEFQRDMNQ